MPNWLIAGLSPSACLRRVQEREKSGIIKGYRARLNRALMGRGLMAYVTVGLSDHTIQAQQEFEQVMTNSEDVVECHNVTGGFEYLLRVEVEDIDRYKQFHAAPWVSYPRLVRLLLRRAGVHQGSRIDQAATSYSVLNPPFLPCVILPS